MLKAMRKNIKSLAPILWIVIATFIIAIFAVWGGAGRIGEGGSAAGVLATVGSHKITTDEFTIVLRQRLEQLKKQVKELNRGLIQQLNLPQRVLEEMVQQNLMLQMADDMGLSASDGELQQRIMSDPRLQRDGQFIGAEEYKNLLNWNHIPISEFEDEIRREIILSKLVRVLTAGVAVTPDRAWENYRKNNETAKVEYVLQEKDKVKLDQEPTPAETQAYFDKNKDKFKIPEKREAAYAFLRTDDLKKEVELTDAEIKKYYNDNEDQFKIPQEIEVGRIFLSLEGKAQDLVLAEARGILDRIGRGEDFAELAKKQSQDAKASLGGNWGTTEWMTLNAKEQDEIKKLEPGSLSSPVALDNGVSILKVIKKTEAATTPLSEAQTRIRTMLQEQKAQALAAERITRLAKDAGREKSLESAAAKVNFKVERTGLLKKGEALGSIDPSGIISAGLFALTDKEISAPLYTYRGVGLAQLLTTVPPHDARLDEVREEVLQDLNETRKKEKILEKLQGLRATLTASQSWEDVAQKNTLEIKTVNEHKRGQYLGTVGENADVDQLAFSLPLNTASDPVEFGNGYLLLRVLSRKEVTPADFSKEKDKEMDSLLAEEGNKLLTSYLAKLREEKGVKIRTDNFMKVQSDILSRFGE
jgi:peptidyl-prolyl cis-trans isomerase D